MTQAPGLFGWTVDCGYRLIIECKSNVDEYSNRWGIYEAWNRMQSGDYNRLMIQYTADICITQIYYGDLKYGKLDFFLILTFCSLSQCCLILYEYYLNQYMVS